MATISWWDTLPEQPDPDASRSDVAAYLRAVQTRVLMAHEDGAVEHEWGELALSPRLTVIVSKRACTIEGRRLRYSARTQYRAGRFLRGWLLTDAIADAIWRNATVRLAPVTLGDGMGGPAPDMALVSAWQRQDNAIRDDWQTTGLVSGEGKDWVSSAGWSAARARNYGWHRPDGRVLQPAPGLFHDPDHSDYSQLGRWVYEECLLDGAPVPVAAVLRGDHSKHLATLCGGPLRSLVPPWELGPAGVT